MAELFKHLESTNKAEKEEARKKILNQFSIVKDSWLLNGLYDYYLSTNSVETIVILISIKEPHYNYLFEKLSDSIGKSSRGDVKVQALTLLGHIVRSQPTWIYKIHEHHLLKDILILLKDETEILPLISALLCLIVLIPIIPYSMSRFLYDVFEIFSRLASWNCNPGRSVEDQMIHLQVALYALFLRLYGMFPCNFLAYLRTQYKDKNKAVFTHTIKPMLETVKMNPSLVTTSKDNETAADRWRMMAVQDIIVECERYSLDVSDTFCAHDSCQLAASGFRSRSGTTSTNNAALESFQSLKNLAASMSNNDRVASGEFFTPSMGMMSQQANSQQQPQPPPTPQAYVPQPEFTHDENVVPQAGSSPPEAAIEATPESTPVIQEKFFFQDVQYTRSSRVQSIATAGSSQPQSPVRKEKSPFNFPMGGGEEFPLSSVVGKKNKTPPVTSPLKIKDDAAKKSPTRLKNEEDDDDLLINDCRINDYITSQMPALKQSDSVLHESEDSTSEIVDEDRSSPCTAGGLHMPNSKSMKDFTKRVQRLRHHSQCNPDIEAYYADQMCSSSPELESTKVRRANSCPEMKKSPVSSIKDNVSRTLDETDEETTNIVNNSAMSNGVDQSNEYHHHNANNIETQTDNLWPMPYEHLFLGIFPTLGTTEATKSSPVPQPMASVGLMESQRSVYDVLDKYIDTAVVENEKDSIQYYKNELKLVQQQLQFERHRREQHAFKNRRFLAEAKNTQSLEEHNSALRDQVQLQQNDIIDLQLQLECLIKEKEVDQERQERVVAEIVDKCKQLENENRQLKQDGLDLRASLNESQLKLSQVMVDKQRTEASLLDTLIEIKFAREQAIAGEKGKAELEYVNKQLLLIGELQIKYSERLDELASLRRSDHELEILTETYNNEVKQQQQRLREKLCKVEAYTSKITELEQLLIQKDEMIASQKRILNTINTENEEKIKALESKYQTQLMISRTMDEKLLELYGQLELSTRKAIRSPDTSSCQEVQVSSDKISGGAIALSQRSSPLSCSLTSSDGSLALLQSDVRDVKGLQALMMEESPTMTPNNNNNSSDIGIMTNSNQDVVEHQQQQPSTSSSTKK